LAQLPIAKQPRERFGKRRRIVGMGFPVERELRDLYRERNWHSYVTYVRLK
jgi:hypothetical protein